MQNWTSRISAALFGAALLSFFLPFLSHVITGITLETWTGIELMGASHVRTAPQLATAAFGCGIAGLGVCFMKDARFAIVRAVLAGIGLFALLASGWSLRALRHQHYGFEGFGLVIHIGFALALLLYLGAAVLNAKAGMNPFREFLDLILGVTPPEESRPGQAQRERPESKRGSSP